MKNVAEVDHVPQPDPEWEAIGALNICRCAVRVIRDGDGWRHDPRDVEPATADEREERSRTAEPPTPWRGPTREEQDEAWSAQARQWSR